MPAERSLAEVRFFFWTIRFLFFFWNFFFVDPETGHSRSVASVAWNNDGSKLATGSCDETVKIWETSTDTCVSTLNGHSRSVTSVAWNNDGTKLASGSYDSTVRIWSVGSTGTFECQSPLTVDSPVYSVAFSPDGTKLASASLDYTVRIWSVGSAGTFECQSLLKGHSDW